jgi:hypothetical protein
MQNHVMNAWPHRAASASHPLVVTVAVFVLLGCTTIARYDQVAIQRGERTQISDAGEEGGLREVIPDRAHLVIQVRPMAAQRPILMLIT